MHTKLAVLPLLMLGLAWPASTQAQPVFSLASRHDTTSAPLVVSIADSSSHSGMIVVRCRATGLPVASVSFSGLYQRRSSSYSLHWWWARRNAYTRRIVRFGQYTVTVRLDDGSVWRRRITVAGGRSQRPLSPVPIPA